MKSAPPNAIINGFILALIAATSYTVNTFDYGVYHDSANALLKGKSPYSINMNQTPREGQMRVFLCSVVTLIHLTQFFM